jgi:predicted ABC-type ATPase
MYLWLPTADLAVARVPERVRVGGDDVPADVVRVLLLFAIPINQLVRRSARKTDVRPILERIS